MPKRALITGITGQDGYYLGNLLLEKGYEVHAILRHTTRQCSPETRKLLAKITTHPADLLDQGSLVRAIEAADPNEVYNLASMSYVPTSWHEPVLCGEVTGLGVVRVLETIRQVNPKIRFYQASSSEMFGTVMESPQTERTPFNPRSPYGVAKVYGHYATVNYRESFGIFACSGILFNHESCQRGKEFVTRKVTDAVARIEHGLQDRLSLGTLEAQRDWGHAADYVRAMWLMLQQDEPDDYVIATGETHTVREMVEIAFEYVHLDWTRYVTIDESNFRPAEVWTLCGDASKAREQLGWEPQVTFRELIEAMVDADMKRVAEMVR